MSPPLVSIGDASLEVRDWGSGEPIVFIQTALGADDLLPLATHPLLADGYRKILYYRRGYAGSAPAQGPGSIRRDAADCRLLMDALGIERAHILGYSYSGAVALELASETPERVQTLLLVEPPPTHTASATEFRAANDYLIRRRHEAGPRVALHEFLTLVIGPNFREQVDEHTAMQMERDTPTFFDVDMPALLSWQFRTADARRITCPTLHVGGTESGQFFSEVRELILTWLPHAEDVRIAGAEHMLVLTHPAEVAGALAEFLRRHRFEDVTQP